MPLILTSLSSVIVFLRQKGPIYCLVWILSYIYLRIHRRFYGRRLDVYDVHAAGDPEKLGYFIPHQEWELESPQNISHLKKNSDDVFCMGVNSKSESLALRILRQHDDKVHCSLALQLENGCTYTLPTEHSVQIETTEPHIFGSSRLKMECLLPMRKWRIFFNGILRETSEKKEEQSLRYRHVRFSFIWTASSDVFDYTCDMSMRQRAHILAKFCSWKCPPTLLFQRLNEMFTGYEQCGMLLGTVTVEDEPEKEIYLWGNRGRNMGRMDWFPEYQALNAFVNAENGTFIRLGMLNVPGILRNVPFGYVMRPNGFIDPVERCKLLKKEESPFELQFMFVSANQTYTVKLPEESAMKFLDANKIRSVKQMSGHMNSMKATALVLESNVTAEHKSSLKSEKRLYSEQSSGLVPDYIPLSVPFSDKCCQMLSVSGGKGSSLAKLTAISKELKTFTVPKGIVVTTSAYKSFTEGILDAPLKKLEAFAWKENQVKSEVNSACKSIMETITKAKLPKDVEQSIRRSMHNVFSTEINNVRFAVRSSATGEDTEQMSAAGQMETFLGCRGISEVLNAVKKCWASQFSFVAVEYKRRYGQLLDTPMAVVIQEMVPCDVAGVAFTCDPVTGNPSYITITANYGLGESVVSGSAEPDTVTLKRDLNNKLHLHSKTAGIKQTKIVMDDSGGTKEVKLADDGSSEYSISEAIALKLGDITVKIETKFGAPRDLEWGVVKEKIFLFQARPVTTIDTETEFELMHMFDTYLRREDEFSSTANVGEVMNGAASTLGLDFMNFVFPLSMARRKFVNWEGESLPSSPYYVKRMIVAYNHFLFCISDAFFKFSESDDEEISNHTKALTVALFGRVIDDKKIFQVAKDRHATEEQPKRSSVFKFIYIVLYMFFAKFFTKRVSQKIDKIRIPVEKSSSAAEALRIISRYGDKIDIAMNNHLDCSFTSPFWNLSLLGLLSKAKGVWDNDVYRDFGYLLSSIKEVESAEIPAGIQILCGIISRCIDHEKFKKMSVDEALKWLQTTSSEAGSHFRQFLVRHGHRCIKEFDIYSKTWAMDPRTLVKSLQGLITKNMEDPIQKKPESFHDIVSKMHVKLNFLQRLQLWFLLPHCHRGVREREVSKSVVINSIDKVRAPFYLLADAMVREGRLPNRELLFFLCPEEIRQLLKTRSPKLVTRAFRRWKCYPEMDKLIFPEMMTGIPKPVNMNQELDISGDGFSMTGVPVSQGVIKGVARVVVNIEDAPSIQHGEILITYSTDIAWSPYFPMLSGVVTELGGLISHGAVVAREYGLPCVVNLHGATRAFKSGDFVLLDGNRGVLQKLESL